MKCFNSKKGQAALSLQQIIGLILAVAIVLASLVMFIGLLKIFMNPPGAGSVATVNYFTDIVNALYSPEQKNVSCYYNSMFVEENRGLAGFNIDGIEPADDNFICKVDKDCIEEHCGVVSDNMVKPKACGKNPCICLCPTGYNTGRGTRTGEFNGKDCTKTGTICKQFNANMGFDTFYRISGSYCDSGSTCDLIYDSEGCNGGGGGVMWGVAFLKSKNFKTGSGAVKWEILDTVSERDSYISKYNAPDCLKMLRDMKKTKAAPVETPKPAAPNRDIRQDIDVAKKPTITRQ